MGKVRTVMTETIFSSEDIERSIPARFEHIARSYPQHNALKEGTTSHTYAALNAGANLIARVILEKYGQQNGSIALVFDKNAKTIMAMLGVLKAGMVYVLLDPGYPAAQLRFMLQDSEALGVLTDSENAELARNLLHENTNTLNIDTFKSTMPASDFNLALHGDTYSSLYYTSGSTGKPKGVIQNHRNILHRAWIHAVTHNVHPGDCQTHLFSPSFTASLPDIYGALLSGATLSAFDVKEQGLALFSNWISDQQITLFHPPLSLLREFVATLADGDQYPDVRLILLGGQRIYKSDVTGFREHCSSSCVVEINLASTEASIHSQYLIHSSDEITENFVPVGFALEDKEILVLDDSLQPLSPGNTGQIGVQSRYISPGYWNDPDLTQKKFISASSDGKPGIYLTGDLGRLHEGGLLEYVGRQDSQVKIRGFRIEINEIENAIHRIETVSQAAVIAVTDQQGDTQIIAYIVPAANTGPSAEELRRSFAKHLPSQMIPSKTVILDVLPKTPSGKVDYETLAKSNVKIEPRSDPVHKPRNAVETKLLEIWQNILRIKQIDIYDNFFELGGHSLLGLRLFLQIESVFGKKYPLTSLFAASTIAEQAQLITRENVSNEWPSLVGVQPHGTKPIFYCVSPIGIDVLAYRGLAMQMGMDQPFYALFSHGSMYQDPFSADLQELAKKYIEEIRAFQSQGPYFLGGYSGGGVVAMEMARQLQALEEEIPFVALLEAYGPSYPEYNSQIPEILIGFLRIARRIEKNLRDFTPWLSMHVENLSDLSWAARIAYIQFKMRRRSAGFKKSVVRRIRKVIFGLQGNKKPRPRPYFDTWHDYDGEPYTTNVVLFRAEKQPLGSIHDPLLGWGKLVTGEIKIHELPGYHDSILFGPRVHHLARLLSETIEESLLKGSKE